MIAALFFLVPATAHAKKSFKKIFITGTFGNSGTFEGVNEVVLDISAQPGAGNLLGNLLCGITNLLNGFNLGNILQGALVNVLTNLLNNLPGIVG